MRRLKKVIVASLLMSGFCSIVWTVQSQFIKPVLAKSSELAVLLDDDTLDIYSRNSIFFYDNSCILPSDEGGGTWKGQTYNLTDGQIYGMIRMAKAEQGTFEGMKFELSLMANLAEYHHYDDVVSYVRTSGWFAGRTVASYSEDRGSITDEEFAAAKDILVNGNRTIPVQILEHDCIGDIAWLEVDGTRHYASGAGMCSGKGLFDKSYYVSGKTKIHNVYGSTYIFYTFPPDSELGSGDPFGYFENNTPSAASTETSSSSSSNPLSKDITLIGDSIAVGAGDKLRAKFPGSFMTMVISRHPTAKGMCDGDEGGLAILRKIVGGSGTVITQSVSGNCESVTIDSNSLKDNIVWELGANPVGADKSTMEAVVSAIGKRKLFLVTPYDGNNLSSTNAISDIYRNLAEEYDNVYIVDWNKEMLNGGASKYLSSDGVHPNSAGQDLLVDLIMKAIEGAQECEMDTNASSYQDRLQNLWRFKQASGTWKDYYSCPSSGNPKGGTGKISGCGCGIMTAYAAHYMFTGQHLDDEAFFTDLRNAMKEDGYIGSGCCGTGETGWGEKSESLTGMKMEQLWGGCGVDCYDDSVHWDMIVNELKKGNKILLGNAGAKYGGLSKFASGYHSTLLDHYDESTDRVYYFDPGYNYVYSGMDYMSNPQNGAYVNREAMKNYIRSYSGWAVTYKDNSCYNICEPVGGSETTPIYPLDEDSVDIACAAGTTDMGTYNNPSWKGKSISIRLCRVDNLTSTGQDDSGFAIVNSRVSGAFHALAERAKSTGVNLVASSSFRTYERQYQFCYTYGWCAIGRAAAPGNSMHELGLAVDFNGTCGFGVSPSSCDASGNKMSLWLRDNTEAFELYRPLSNEAWHVQPLLNGGN